MSIALCPMKSGPYRNQYTLVIGMMNEILCNVLWMQIFGVHCLVELHGVAFHEVVCHVHDSGCPEDTELFLVNVIAYPIESHLNGVGALLFDVFVGNATCYGDTNLDRCWR